MPIVARIWFGKTLSASHAEYIEYVKKTGISSLRQTPGNRGVLLLSKADQEPEIGVISFWDSRKSIEAFAGKDISRAVYYPEDSKYLVNQDPYLLHYDVPVIEGIDLKK